jgi:hypothetical protein
MQHLTTDRRTFLRGLGVGLALPALESFAGKATPSPHRLLAIETNMGILPKFFFPEKTGRDYVPTPYLEILNRHREQLTVFSGVSHPEVDGGHQAEICFLTAAPHPGRGGFRNSISLDQFAAERIGHLTRFPSLTLTAGTGGSKARSISFTASGVQIPGESSPAQLFRKLFVQGSPAEVEAQLAKLQQSRSILDSVAERARQLQSEVTASDRQKLDQFFTGVRELEQRLNKSEVWERTPKQTLAVQPPQDVRDPAALVERMRAMFDLSRLAFDNDSTRLITIFIDQNDVKPNIPGVDAGTHPLTHHGNQPEKLEQLRLIEEAQFRELARLLDGLADSQQQGTSLLERTAVLYGTCMGNANAHSNSNLPVLLAGGGFKHGQHIGFDLETNYPLPNLFVSMLQRQGIETDNFASSTGTMRGLEIS